MSDARMTRALVVVAALLAATAAMVTAAPRSQADDRTLGVAAIAPERGDSTTPITLTTAGPCPRGTNTLTKIFGGGFPADGENVVGNQATTDFGSPPNGWLVVPLTITIQEAVRRQATPFQPAGDYRIVLTCRDPLPSAGIYEYGDYVARLRFGSDGRYRALTTAADLPRSVRSALSQPAPTSPGEPDPTGAPTAAGPELPATAPDAADGGGSRSAAVAAGALVGAALVLGGAYLFAARSRDDAARRARANRPSRAASSRTQSTNRSKRPQQNPSRKAQLKDQPNRSGTPPKRQQKSTSRR